MLFVFKGLSSIITSRKAEYHRNFDQEMKGFFASLI